MPSENSEKALSVEYWSIVSVSQGSVLAGDFLLGASPCPVDAVHGLATVTLFPFDSGRVDMLYTRGT